MERNTLFGGTPADMELRKARARVPRGRLGLSAVAVITVVLAAIATAAWLHKSDKRTVCLVAACTGGDSSSGAAPARRAESGGFTITMKVARDSTLLENVRARNDIAPHWPRRCYPASAVRIVVSKGKSRIALEQFAPLSSRRPIITRIDREDNLGDQVAWLVSSRVYMSGIVRVALIVGEDQVDSAPVVDGWIALAAPAVQSRDEAAVQLVGTTTSGRIGFRESLIGTTTSDGC